VTPGSWVTCESTGEITGDADLYVRYNAAPVIADGIYDCASYSSTDSNEACALVAPDGDASVLWATIQGWSAAENVILTCTSNSFDPAGGGAQGDPHFKTWRGQHYNFHGVCDLILLQIKEFASGLGLDVHIRTYMRRDMSYICSSAVLRIGSDVLEVESQGVYYFNGVAGANLPSEFGRFEFLQTQPTDKQHVLPSPLLNVARHCLSFLARPSSRYCHSVFSPSLSNRLPFLLRGIRKTFSIGFSPS
jgi:hypothetical protein